ncbi:transcriptional coactivator/pterin dehydratase [Aulographum hederae CBS 113979]|uniref:4a-hydroxytetrahydrobiopterin dehydratase n=1 Tax=Aulographum hederae CBS 113979 TaxID=1176131 RepID=A0A6G1H1F2_9PEZI|nr:transcriptional coactivator/pterin dehydratase [Aulographum hederae CBS 113979]
MASASASRAQEATSQIHFASSADPRALTPRIDALLTSSQPWRLTASRNGLERVVGFKTFKKTWEFMNRVAAECQKAKHHPEWANVYNRVHIRWTTHQPPGLSENDVNMVEFCDRLAEELGQVKVEIVEETLRGLVDTIENEAGDCCAPKKL